MCGLYGCITKQGKELTTAQAEKRNNILKGMAVAMQSRGTHSTGIAGINDDHYSFYKQAISADEFIQQEGVSKFLKHNYPIVIGHTRYATVGDINDLNAHPFQYGNIVGCHNGSVSNYDDVETEHNTKLDVDSQAIFFLLDKYGNDYKKAFSELTGRFAITWFDVSKPNTLHIVLDGNPLTIVRIPELETYFFTSEEYSLQAIIASHFPLSGKSFWTPKTDHVYTIDTNFSIKKKKVSFKPYVSKITTYDYSKYSGYRGYKGYDDDYYGDGYVDDDKEVKKLIGEPKKEDKKKSYKERTGFENPFATKNNWEKVMDFTEPDMKKIMVQVEGDGCEFCNVPIDFTREEGFWWHDIDKVALCIDCAEELDCDFKNLTWVDENDYLSITEEMEELEKDTPDFLQN